jgi:RND family efflux transporter MFP subunit
MIQRLFCFLALIPLSLAALAQSAPPARVAVAEVERGPVYQDLRLQGSVIGGEVAMLSTSVSGLIIEAPPRPGTRVTEGEALLQLDAELAEIAVEQATAARQQAEALVADVRRREQEGEQLLERGDLPRSVQDSRSSERLQAEAQLAERIARQRLAEEQLRRHRLAAPFAGTVAQRFVAVGEWVNPGDPLLGLVNDQSLWLEFALPQRYYGQIPMRAPITVTLAGREDRVLSGLVAGVIPFSDSAARQLRLRVELDDWPAVAPGSSAQGKLRLDLDEQAVLVPRDGINRYPDGRTTVWLAEDDNGAVVAREQRIELRGEFDDTVAVRTGLRPGARVVVRGNEGLTAGRALTVLEEGRL